MHPYRSTGRAILAITTAILAAAATVTPATVAAATARGRPPAAARPAAAARDAAGWLARHLVGRQHDHYVDTYQGRSYPDYGNTADAILAMDAAHVARRAAARATAWLAANITGYTADTCDPSTTTYYPGSLAKALLVAEAEHRNGRDFGGSNLIRELEAEETPQGQPQAGLYADPDTGCGYQSPVTQALALVALSHTAQAPDRPDAAAVGWLVAQQCRDGGFLGSIRTGGGACGRSSEDVDTTAFAAQALHTVGARRAAGKAMRWLLDRQHPNGSFGNPPVGANVNSTAVAVQALLTGNHRKLAAAGQRWIAARQVGCAAPASRRGSLDYQGNYVGGSTQLVATTQGTQALAGGRLGDIDRSRASTGIPRMTCHRR